MARTDLVPDRTAPVPDPPRWIGCFRTRRRAGPIASGSPGGHVREVDHAAIDAPSKVLSLRSPPSRRPPRAASTSATCLATLRRSSSTEPRHREQLSPTCQVEPAHQGHPPLRRRAAHLLRRTGLRANHRAGRAVPVRCERQRHRAGPVQATSDQPTRTDHQDRPARSASIATQQQHDAFGLSCGRLRTQHLSLQQTVTDDHQPTAHGQSGGLAARARAGSRLGARGQLLAPGLDSQHARDKPLGASCLFYGGCEARRRGRSREEAPSPSPLSAGCSPFEPALYRRRTAMAIIAARRRTGGTSP